MLRVLTGLIVAVMLPVIGMSPAHAQEITGSMGSPTSNCGHYSVGVHPSPVFMVGDSITHRGKPFLRRLRPHWAITAKHGRNVDCVVPILKARLDSDVPVRMLVIALGTNATEGWKQRQYQDVINQARAVNPDTRVVFVNTWRSNKVWPHDKTFRVRASVQWWYSRYMANLARSNDNVCVVPWRWTAEHHQDLIQSDGVHPYVGRGTTMWAHRVSRSVAKCDWNK